MEITEEAARIMKESGYDEIVYYSKELDMYIWGITHYGTSWKLMLTSIPISEDNVAWICVIFLYKTFLLDNSEISKM